MYSVIVTPPQDLLSADDDVLTDVLVYHKPPARRLPPLILTRLLADVAEYVVEGSGGLLAWYHRAFREASRRRYLGDRARSVRAYAALADSWCGRWAEEAKPPLPLAKIAQVLEAPSCSAPPQPARFGGGSKAKADQLDEMRKLAGRMSALMAERAALLALLSQEDRSSFTHDQAPSCGALLQLTCCGGGSKAKAGLLDGPPNLRMLAERVPALLTLLALFRDDPSAAPPNLAYYRSALEDALSDPAFVDASLEGDLHDAARLRLLGWAHTFERLAIAETSPGPGLGDSPLAPLFSRLKEKTLMVADVQGNTLTSVRFLSRIAIYIQFASRYADSLPLCECALAIREKALGPEHPATATSLNNLASLYQAMGRHADALPLFERALSIKEKALGPEHPTTCASLNNLACLYQVMGRHADALPLLERALSIHEKARGPEHHETATFLGNLASMYQSMGRHADAIHLFERALSVREKALGPEHPDTAASLNNLARLYQAMGRLVDALTLFERALAIREKALGPESPDTAASLGNLARLYQASNDN